jgi:AraC-like DNA-binding protein
MRSDRDVKPRLAEPSPSTDSIEEVTHGGKRGEPSVTMLGGYFAFDPLNAPLLLDYLPRMLRLNSATPSGDSVAAVVQLIRQEAQGERDGRAFVLTSLLEVMLVEALRSAPIDLHSTGLLTGLRHPQIAVALRCIHGKPEHPWTLASLAREAGMSRSSFAERFASLVGLTPLNYLLQWRLSMARHLLVHEGKPVAEAALAVGYESASGFSTAFSREMGQAPREFARTHRKMESGPRTGLGKVAR